MKRQSLYTLLSVKSKKGLGFTDKIWMKLTGEVPINEYGGCLSSFMLGKLIEEEEREVDIYGREVIHDLCHKRYRLTPSGEKYLKKLKWLYLKELLARYIKNLLENWHVVLLTLLAERLFGFLFGG